MVVAKVAVMDGYFTSKGVQKTIAFLTPGQAEAYGGYVAAAKVLHVDFVRSPHFIEEHWPDFSEAEYPEVGHA